MSDPVITALRTAGCVFAEDEARLLRETARTPEELDALVRRRVVGEPLEHVLGWAEFAGRRFAVAPGVFVPRHRTEFLVDLAVGLLEPGDVVLDLCCGTGALGAVVADRVDVELHSSDVDPASVECARRNVPTAYLGDLFDPLPTVLKGRFAAVLANVPYVPTDAIALMPPEARDHEVRVALDGGPDGLDVLRRVAAEAPDWLAPRGHLLSEIGERQAEAALEAFEAAGLSARLAQTEDALVILGRN
ncbi:putative protein N(5)-glutamine methyltransferase [Actinosynnema sp. NPDC020468]|uniref:putative protein N(5)-glutamine methyltransferase n=1 Tax=Actinosynnema sp. NPDC020468 TaxID=3154488 RepID=UPI0033DE51E7